MTKKLRQQVYDKYGGLCAYTGKPLGDDWQVDHQTSVCKHSWDAAYNCGTPEEYLQKVKEVNRLENLFPACRIVNHYKRGLDLEGFRRYMSNFHIRLGKLPKKTLVPATQRRKEYLYKVAELFDITPDKPFSGQFYFETL